MTEAELAGGQIGGGQATGTPDEVQRRYRRLVQRAQADGRIPALAVALHRADRSHGRSGGGPMAYRVEPVLRIELCRDIVRPQRHADDAPVAVAGTHCVVGINRLMRAVKGANSEMDDTHHLAAPFVGWRLHRRRQPCPRRQPHSRYAALTKL